jgi:hypothetical protein
MSGFLQTGSLGFARLHQVSSALMGLELGSGSAVFFSTMPNIVTGQPKNCMH